MLKEKCAFVCTVVLEKLGLSEKTNLADLDNHYSILVEPQELGQYKTIISENREIHFRVPQKIIPTEIQRLKGLGKTKGKLTGNILIQMWLNKGIDVNTTLWLSEDSAWKGTHRTLWTSNGIIQVIIPKGSKNNSLITMKGFGDPPKFGAGVYFDNAKRGDLFIRLRTYQDSIEPRYGSFGSLSTEAMGVEGWVYKKIDEIISKLGTSILNYEPITADEIAEVYNETGWHGIFTHLRNRLNLTDIKIEIVPTGKLTRPGECHMNLSQYHDAGSVYVTSAVIYIDQAYLCDPIFAAAILAHELCHVVYSQNFLKSVKSKQTPNDPETLEQERAVDLLLFMFRLGGFQIRVSRDRNLTLGYFNQEMFDRMFVIVTKEIKKRRKKLSAANSRFL
jgi:hypothetical protein